MATSRSFIKCLKRTCEIVFLLYLVVEILQLVHSSFPEVLYKKCVLKNVSKFTDKHKKQSSRVRFSVKRKDVLKNLQNSQQNIFSGVTFLIKLQAGNLQPSEAATGDGLQLKKSIYFLSIRSTYSIRYSYGNQVETSLSSCVHTCTDLGSGSERKGRTEKLVKVGKIPLSCNGRLRNFHIPEK